MRRTIGVALLASALTLLAAEVLLRIFGLAPEPGLFTVTEREYARVPGIFQPGQVVVEAAGTRFVHRTHINALGYRGAELPLAKPAGEYRVLFVGDSFTWGHNVADDSTMPAALERVLQTACGRARVVNAGISGMTILGEDAMALRGLAVQPDAVVLMAHENDIDELAHSRLWEQLAENRRTKSRFPVSLVYPVLRSSALWNLVLEVRRARAPYLPQRAGAAGAADTAGRAPRPTDSAAAEDAVTPDVAAARREYRARLTALVDSLRGRRVPLVVALYPHPASMRRGRATGNQTFVRAVAESLGVPTVDVLDSLRVTAASVDSLYLLPEDYHPSPRGHTLGAAYVAPRLLAAVAAPGCNGVPAR